MDEPCPKSSADLKKASHEQAIPYFAGLASRAQQAEMRLILAGKWPALKPLPVFKYETDEYRAAIDFDKLRGEWVCRKTSFPSNKVQELRGGLTELTLALPHGRAEVFAEDVAENEQEQELEKDVSRRQQALLEWKRNCENGAFCSELESYLSESQRCEIYDCIRLTLTARQLQFIPKNVGYVFDALSKAGGRLATLLEIAQRNKAGRSADSELLAGEFAPQTMGSFAPGVSESLSWTPVESLSSTTLDRSAPEPMESVFPEEIPISSPEPTVHSTSETSPFVEPGIPDASPPPLFEDFRQKGRRRTPNPAFGSQVRTDRVESSGVGISGPRSRSYVLEISGFQIATIASVILFVVISMTVGFTLGGGTLGKRFRDAEKTVLAVDSTPPAALGRSGETISQTSSPADRLNDAPPSEEKSRGSAQNSGSFAKDPATDFNSSPAIEAKPSPNPVAGLERKGSRELMARNAPPPAMPKSAHAIKVAGPISGATRFPVPRKVAAATSAVPHSSSTILVRGPGDGSKPFRLTLPEKPIAASSSFAMTSQLSVLVSPEPGLAGVRKPARLQAGEIVSFVWPHYPRPGDRYGSSETVKVRTTIGELGQVEDVKLVSGSTSLFPAAMSAIRLWRYKPTLVNEKPVRAQEDVTIEFRR